MNLSVVYSIHCMTSNTATAMKCVRKKDVKYIRSGSQLSDKQIQHLGR